MLKLLAVISFFIFQSCAGAAYLTVHYNRFDGNYQDWKLWLWNASDNKEGSDLSSDAKDAFGLIFTVDLETKGLAGKRIGILPKLREWESKDPPDRVYTPDLGLEIYLLQGDQKVYSQKPDFSPRIVRASLERDDSIAVVFSRPPDTAELLSDPPVLTACGTVRKIRKMELGIKDKAMILALTIDQVFEADLASINRGEWKVAQKTGEVTVWLGGILDSEKYYSDKPLGVTFNGDTTTVRVFAPAAIAASLLLYDGADSGEAREIPMTMGSQGIWEASLNQKLSNVFYKIRVTRNGKTVEGIDPYSLCNTAHDGRGLIFTDSTEIAPSPVFDPSESVIYELHLRDFTIDPCSGVKKRGKYLGLAEAGTRHAHDKNLTTGADHLKELGVNVVQIMPFQDFENDDQADTYNWGYMPVHFNSPDGWYATETRNSKRVSEVKTMISHLHQSGIRVVMDVVYNHTAENNPEKNFGLNAMADGYYYRRKPDGSLWNGSGCGNEFRSESLMGRRFLIDSLKYWVSEYKVDGFRFDLMGLIDLETMVIAARELKKIKPEILIYGEPWSGGDTPIIQTVKGRQKGNGFSVFNDDFRDAIKGSVWDMKPGYVQEGLFRDRVRVGIMGSIDTFAESPLETINYVSCHDNQTLWDRIILTEGINATTIEMKDMDMLANAIILTSQGIPFIHSGEEMLRTKKGEHNSYNLPDEINQIKWDWKKNSLDVFNYYRQLIQLRKDHPAFRMKTAAEVRHNLKFYEDLKLTVPDPCIAYVLDGAAVKDSWKKIVVLINPNRKEQEFPLPAGKFKIGLDREGFYQENFKPAEKIVTVQPISLMLLFEK
ncbi:MAG: type I pullulanase [Candidatus Wallbacteria bacterium]|nr:type I pullulanase [Candidatus Wallbacteria bacterium]